MATTSAFIFARGGSKGLPRKNVLSISGIPMLAHGIRIARSLKEVDNIFVSTDCDEISSIAQDYGADVIRRPHELASDTAPEWLAWQHAIRYVQERHSSFDRFLSLPATAPLRNIEDVRACLNALKKGVDFVITVTPSGRSPWFNMVTLDKNQLARLVLGNGEVKRRQDAMSCFDITTVAYVSRPEFILNSTGIWDGSVVGVEVPRSRSIDVDDEYDFKIARFLMEDSKLP